MAMKTSTPPPVPAAGFPWPGGGAATPPAPALFRGTTVQVCGLWPWVIGTEAPLIGVPLGHHVMSGAPVCCDPISWFQIAKLIGNPSAFVLGNPGLGKSTLIRRTVTGLSGFGIPTMILGDLKGEYADLVRVLDGQVIRLGRGRGAVNPLDPGETRAIVEQLRAAGHEREADALNADAHGRRLATIETLIAVIRHDTLTGREVSILDACLKELDTQRGIPVLADLLRVLQDGPEPARVAATDHGDKHRYQELTDSLEAALVSLVTGGRLGDMFAQPTSEPIRRGQCVSFDISGIPDTDKDMAAAALMACWSTGFASMTAGHVLADAGLGTRQAVFAVMDELWRVLQAGEGMVDRTNAATRLNRQWGMGSMMCTHTMSDLDTPPTVEDRAKARGLVERSGMVMCGGLPEAEMPKLTQVRPFSRAEQDLLVGWQDSAGMDDRGVAATPPGQGHFLIKVSGRPGIPVKVALTRRELAVNDTNQRWH